MHQTIVNYRQSRYLWLSLAIGLIAIVSYIIYDPPRIHGGDTPLGYVFGIVSVLLIGLLMWFGIRKRSYSSRTGTVMGWLSAHIYLGAALLIVATLHTGFQFSWNVHSLAYVLMVIVIINGIFGVYCYLHYPLLMSENRQGTESDSLIKQIQDVDRQALAIASEIGDETHNQVLNNIRRTNLGGSVFKILFGKTDIDMEKLVSAAMQEQKKLKEKDVDSTMAFMADRIANDNKDSGQLLEQLTDLLSRQKQQLVIQLRRDIQLKAYMDLWLYVHVPFSFAMLAALFIHIYSVLFY